MFAYFAIGLIAVSLVVKYVFTKLFDLLTDDILYWMENGAYILLSLVALISAFTYAHSRRNAWFMVLLVLFVAIIVIFTFVI